MKTRAALTRRGFMTTAALGAASVGLSLPSALGSTARPLETEGSAPERQPLRLNRNESPYGFLDAPLALIEPKCLPLFFWWRLAPQPCPMDGNLCAA